MQHTEKELKFIREIANVINCNSFENRSDTPDFIVAEYMFNSLKAFEAVNNRRETWYGRAEIKVCDGIPVDPNVEDLQVYHCPPSSPYNILNLGTVSEF